MSDPQLLAEFQICLTRGPQQLVHVLSELCELIEAGDVRLDEGLHLGHVVGELRPGQPRMDFPRNCLWKLFVIGWWSDLAQA